MMVSLLRRVSFQLFFEKLIFLRQARMFFQDLSHFRHVFITSALQIVLVVGLKMLHLRRECRVLLLEGGALVGQGRVLVGELNDAELCIIQGELVVFILLERLIQFLLGFLEFLFGRRQCFSKLLLLLILFSKLRFFLLVSPFVAFGNFRKALDLFLVRFIFIGMFGTLRCGGGGFDRRLSSRGGSSLGRLSQIDNFISGD
jgi:hypothetical protein